ncbi:hypothetical protein FD31_GL001305 [Companilactobacillus nantensis DSM 16982]|uniref:Uncharacterized protein n=1 Tax=Companilactobacillus nantensis DSM 16982 TaxID=1423774 RepID=A0A0R1WBQ6_9LACO|nr:hypothetical protein FD31_GL001305 [Companilactobacillus nantensis DSM 16982]
MIFQIDNGTVALKKGNDFWNEVKQQDKVYGDLSTGQLDWNSDMGEEVIFD